MSTNASFKSVSPVELKTMLRDGDELALIDVREQGIYFDEHLLFACCIPLGQLEVMTADLIPRRSSRIVLCDGGPGDAGRVEKAATCLAGFGYSDIAILQDGVAGWREAGYELFSGINVPSKAFGEFVEINYDTPHISAEDLNAKLAAGEKLVILDSRPMPEFNNMSIPGGIDCPGAELAYRVHDQVSDPDIPVVVNCAGRTRSIIGAQSLLNAGIPNPVMALKDGTMGWKLAGYDLAHGHTEHAAEPSPQGLAKAKASAEEVGKRFGVQKTDFATIKRWQAEADQRTLYVLDVRTPEEFAAGHLPDSRHAPGGQLVQATDEYMATRNARVVLVDDTEVRATMSASWLIQMNWDEVYVLIGGVGNAATETGVRLPEVLGQPETTAISVSELKAKLDKNDSVVVLDFATSLQYRKQHIPGAWWGMRTRLEQALAKLPAHQTLVLTSPDGMLAQFAALDIAALGHDAELRVLTGGTQAWSDAGLEVEQGADRVTCETDDVWYKPYEHRAAVEQAMRDYLTWEVNLVEQIERDGDARFRVFS